MSIRLLNCDEKPVSYSERVTLRPDQLDPNQVAGAISVFLEGRVLPMDQSYLVEGVMQAEGDLLCSRCLAPVAWEGSEGFSVEFRHPLEGSDDEVELDESDLDVVFLDGDELDVERLAAEQVMLNLPMRILCQPECAGLCPSCGANLNQAGTCHCEPEVDPRWEGLRDLKGEPS